MMVGEGENLIWGSCANLDKVMKNELLENNYLTHNTDHTLCG